MKRNIALILLILFNSLTFAKALDKGFYFPNPLSTNNLQTLKFDLLGYAGFSSTNLYFKVLDPHYENAFTQYLNADFQPFLYPTAGLYGELSSQSIKTLKFNFLFGIGFKKYQYTAVTQINTLRRDSMVFDILYLQTPVILKGDIWLSPDLHIFLFVGGNQIVSLKNYNIDFINYYGRKEKEDLQFDGYNFSVSLGTGIKFKRIFLQAEYEISRDYSYITLLRATQKTFYLKLGFYFTAHKIL